MLPTQPSNGKVVDAAKAREQVRLAAAGYATASLTATLSGIPLYRSLGYRSGQPVTLALPDKLTFVALAMEKPVAAAGSERTGATSACTLP